MIITIDGPAGSGKSTAARKLAARLEIAYLDTGAMYRAVAHTALSRGIDMADVDALVAMAEHLTLHLDCGPTHTRIRVDGHDVSEAIRSMKVSTITSQVAKHQKIRTILIEQQQQIGAELGSLVTEGRDQGSVVFPDADAKFVLEASVKKRAERRYQEMNAEGEDVSMKEVIENIESRDKVDSKQWEPLLNSNQAIVIYTSDMTIRQVVDEMVEQIPLM